MRDTIERLRTNKDIIEIKDEIRYDKVVDIANRYGNKTILFHNIEKKERFSST